MIKQTDLLEVICLFANIIFYGIVGSSQIIFSYSWLIIVANKCYDFNSEA
jgi:hypothetical protein